MYCTAIGSMVLYSNGHGHFFERTFEVTIGESLLRSRSISSAVPEGSVLEQLLVIIYVNDLSDKLSNVCKLFKDDSKSVGLLSIPPSIFTG